MSDKNKVCVGMTRPTLQMIQGGSPVCPGCKEQYHYFKDTRIEHWQLGHYDTPVYITAEEAYKIMLNKELFKNYK